MRSDIVPGGVFPDYKLPCAGRARDGHLRRWRRLRRERAVAGVVVSRRVSPGRGCGACRMARAGQKVVRTRPSPTASASPSAPPGVRSADVMAPSLTLCPPRNRRAVRQCPGGHDTRLRQKHLGAECRWDVPNLGPAVTVDSALQRSASPT